MSTATDAPTDVASVRSQLAQTEERLRLLCNAQAEGQAGGRLHGAAVDALAAAGVARSGDIWSAPQELEAAIPATRAERDRLFTAYHALCSEQGVRP